MSNQPSGSKNHSKRQNSNRDRDKNKTVASTESGGSSQCDTPPLLNDKTIYQDPNLGYGKYAGITPESVQCMAEQVGSDIGMEAVINLAEDASYKLRQVINTIALHSGMMKKCAIDSVDVNTVLQLMDTGPVIGSSATQYASFGEEKLCHQIEHLVNVTDCAMTNQTYVHSTQPKISVEWVTDEKSLSNDHNISANLQNYYIKVARAILNVKKKLKEVAVEDLKTNTRIGPIFPNLFNLAVLVLNDDNLNALNVPSKKPLQSNVLDMVDALCSNPCSLDTDIQQQFQRLFPVMVSNILGNGSLSDKMVAILTKITRTWPPFVTIGKGVLFEYLSQGTKERLTAQMIKCVMALGRQALVECLAENLDHIDDTMHGPRKSHRNTDLRETILDASTCLLQSELTTFLEDYVTTDYTLYEMLGDSILPRRLVLPVTEQHIDNTYNSSNKNPEEDFLNLPMRTVMRRSKIRLMPRMRKLENSVHREAVFEPVKFDSGKISRIKFKVSCFRNVPVMLDHISASRTVDHKVFYPNTNCVVAVSGLLNRFRFKLKKNSDFPLLALYML